MTAGHPVPLLVVALRDRWQQMAEQDGALSGANVYLTVPTQNLESPVAVGVAVPVTEVAPVRTSSSERLGRDDVMVDVACLIEVASGNGPDPLERMTRVYAVLDELLADVAASNTAGWPVPGVTRTSITATAWSDGPADNGQGLSSLDFTVMFEVSRRRR